MTPRVDGQNSFLVCTYGSEDVIPTEVGMLTVRTNNFSQEGSNLALSKGLDMVKENKEIATIKLAKYQQMVSWGYNKNVNTWEFIPQDLVLRKVTGNTWDPS